MLNKTNTIIAIGLTLLLFVSLVSSSSNMATIYVKAAQGSDITIDSQNVGKTPGNTGCQQSSLKVSVPMNKKITIKAFHNFGNGGNGLIPTSCGCKGISLFYVGQITITVTKSGQTVTVPQHCCVKPDGSWCMPI